MSDPTISEAAKKAAEAIVNAFSGEYLNTGKVSTIIQSAIDADRAAREKDSPITEVWEAIKRLRNEISITTEDHNLGIIKDIKTLCDYVSANAATPIPQEIVTLLGQATSSRWFPKHPMGGREIYPDSETQAAIATFLHEADCELAIAAVNFVAQFAKGATPMPMEVVSKETGITDQQSRIITNLCGAERHARHCWLGRKTQSRRASKGHRRPPSWHNAAGNERNRNNMNEPNETPDGRLAEYLIGDLGPARRHIARLLNNELPPSRSVLTEIQASIERCIRRIERDSPISELNDQTKEQKEKV